MDERIDLPTGHSRMVLALCVNTWPASGTSSRTYLHAALRRRSDYQALAFAGSTESPSLVGEALVIGGGHFNLKPAQLKAATDWLQGHGVTVRDLRDPAQAAA